LMSPQQANDSVAPGATQSTLLGTMVCTSCINNHARLCEPQNMLNYISFPLFYDRMRNHTRTARIYYRSRTIYRRFVMLKIHGS